MNFTKKILIALISFNLNAQIDGDNIFAEDQIIIVDLVFEDSNFWELLQANYQTGNYLEADLTITDNTGTTIINQVGVRLKGNSSYSHPGNKKSFKIDFNEYVSGQNYDGLKKLNFNNGFKDPTLMREKIFFDLCQDAGVPAPRANFASIYFNGELWGFYTVVEQIDDQFLDWRILDDDGNLFKAGDNFQGNSGEANLVYYGDSQTAYEDRYELKTNETENDWTDLIQFIDFINNASTSEFESELGNYIELQEYLRSAAINNLFSNLDTYTLSARNYYVYHNQTTNKWEWIKWDANECFGSYSGGPGGPNMTTLPLNFTVNNRPLLQNIFSSSVLYNQYLQEVCYVSNNLFNPTELDFIIDNFKSLIQDAVFSDPNKMYSNADFINNIENNIGGGGGLIYGLKSFVQEKASFISGEIDCNLGSEQSLEIDFKIYPNPASKELFIQSSQLVKSLIVHDFYGKKIFEIQINSNSKQLDISKLKTGIYLCTAESETGMRSTQKLIIRN